MQINDFTALVLKKIRDEKIEQIQIGQNFNYDFPNLPPCIKVIFFGRKYDINNNKIYSDNDYSSKFNQKIYDLPENLSHLSFPFKSDYNQPFNNFPSSLIHLLLGNSFNQPINNLPPNLKYLLFGNSFNQYIEYYPATLHQLTFGNSFNKPVDKLSTTNLEFLTFGNNFNQSINNLPDTLNYLYLSKHFNQPINNLPDTLNYLYLNDYFNQSLDNLPKQLSYLTLYINKFDYLLDKLPNSLKTLIFNVKNNHKCRFNCLPENITNLEICTPCIFKFDCLPNKLKKFELHIDNYSNDKNRDYNLIDNLPTSLIHLEIWANVNVNYLPNSIKELYISSKCTQPIDFLPNGIEYLNIDCQKVNLTNLPQSIKKLRMTNCEYISNFTVTHLKNLEHLEIIDCNLKKINKLPENLQSLIIYNTKIFSIPPSLKWIGTNSSNRNIKFYKQLNPNVEIKYFEYAGDDW